MALDDRSLRATSFGAIAEDYDRFRPGPPVEAVEWVLPRRSGAVVEIGAGTGALSRRLVHAGRLVVALEPDPRMGAVLQARVPEIDVMRGRAEDLPLPGDRFDALVGASMWHWVDAARAATEVARVLRPGGVFGLLWSGPDRSQGWLSEVLGRSARAGLVASTDRARRRRHEVHLPEEAPFSEPETHVVHWSLTVTPDEVIGLAGTYSAFIVLPEAERAQLRADLTDVVRNHPEIAGRETIDLPMRCLCWRAVRLT